MERLVGRTPRPGRAATLALGALFIGLAGLAPACAPAEDAREDGDPAATENEAAPADAAAENGAATADAAGEQGAEAGVQETPVCRFTASGEQLTGRASPPDSATVELGGQTAKLCYGAPSVRGREVMGGLVPYGEPWRMGANEPTTLHLPFAAEVGTVRLDPGSYALYAVPGESEWTIVLNDDPERWGIPIDEEVRARDVGSFTVQAESLEESAERLSIDMESAQDGAANVVLEWERTRVSFPLRRVQG